MINLKQIIAKILTMPKQFFFLAIPIVGIFIVIIFSSLLSSPKPQVVKTNPNNEEKNVSLSLSQISIFFNKPLKSIDEVSVSVSPLVKFSPRLSNDKKSLMLSLSGTVGETYGGPQQKLLEDNQYVVEILDEKERPIYSWVFRTVKFSEVGKGSPAISQEIEAKDQKDYPLLHYIPFENDQFIIDYVSSQHLEVKLKTASPSAAKALVEQWVKQKGVNPASHQITFISE